MALESSQQIAMSEAIGFKGQTARGGLGVSPADDRMPRCRAFKSGELDCSSSRSGNRNPSEKSIVAST
jgi:hypothetical protein